MADPLKHYLQVIHEEGYTVRTREQAKHVKLRATYPATGGREHLLVLPCSPGDRRALLNFRSDIRRIIRQEARP